MKLQKNMPYMFPYHTALITALIVYSNMA